MEDLEWSSGRSSLSSIVCHGCSIRGLRLIYFDVYYILFNTYDFIFVFFSLLLL